MLRGPTMFELGFGREARNATMLDSCYPGDQTPATTDLM
jgi:hypothetical protein